MTNLPTLEDFEAEDRAAEALMEQFRSIGRSHAIFAIDQNGEYDDSRGSHEENLHDTMAEQHRGATTAQIYAAIDAYNAAWDAYLNRKA